MKKIFKNTRSWRDAEKCISDSSEELKSLQNCPEDLKKRGAKLLVSKTLPSPRWKNHLGHKMASPPKSIRNTDNCVSNKLKISKSDLDIVNEVLYFEKSEPSKNSPNENFSFFLEEKERSLASEKSVAPNETSIGSQKTPNSVLDSDKSIEVLNEFIKNSKESIHIDNPLSSQERRETGNTNNDETAISSESRIPCDNIKKSPDNVRDTLLECECDNLSQQRPKKMKKDSPEYNTSAPDILTPKHKILYECATVIMEILTKFPTAKFSVVFMKIFNALKMKDNSNNEQALLEMMKKMMSALQAQTNHKSSDTDLNSSVPKPRDAKKEALVQKFTSPNKPPVKVVFAEMMTLREINSYNEAKDVLAKVFEIPYKDFAGLTRMPESNKFSFMIEEAALIRYGKERPNQSAGSIRPWSKEEFENRPLTTIICNKIAENPPRNKAIKEDAKKLLKTLKGNDYGNPENFTLDMFIYGRYFSARKP
jgi:hypothetical protein